MNGHQVVLASRPHGTPVPENFRLEEVALPGVSSGQVRLAVRYASVDPYMRTKMNDAESYTPPYRVGDVISSRTVCQVEDSRDPRLQPGDMVAAFTGWQSHAVVDAADVTPINTALAPAPAYLGVLGMPGFTAYCGLEKIGRPVAGETLVVAAAVGPVGATVAQLAMRRGLNVVAIAGGERKTRILREALRIETVLDHRSADLVEQVAHATPAGVDIYFENVGGRVADAVLPRMNLYGRVPLCGMVADYNRTGSTSGPDRLPDFYRHVLTKSLDVRGFLSSEFEDELHETFVEEMGELVRGGVVRHLEHIVDGLERAPFALISMLRGDNIGKTIVQVS